MKFKYLIPTIFSTLSLTGCIAPLDDFSFDSKLLEPQIYNKYWAMEPQNDVANILKITPEGTATLYRYSCDSLNQYRTKNKGTFGQIIEKLARKADEKLDGSGNPIRAFLDIERYKLETIGKNEIKMHAIFIGGWSSMKFTQINHNSLKATQTIFKGIGGIKQINYTNSHSPSFPICKDK